ncbi:MAG: PAS domain S-box protein [Pirellulales bacterium]|nr:PAS domain S-box protein [Pirellulales bacterium]
MNQQEKPPAPQIRGLDGPPHDSEVKFRLLVETLPDFVLLIDRYANIRFVNRHSPNVSMEELIGTSGLNHVVPEDHPQCCQAVERAFASGEVQAVEVRTVHGSCWDCRVVRMLEDDATPAAMIICADITDRKKAEAQIQQKKRRLRQLLEMHEGYRQLVAYEIHDGLAQPLAGAMLHFQAFCQMYAREPRQAWQKFEEGTDILHRTLSESRRLMSGLRPLVLDDSGLLDAIEYLVSEAAQPNGPQIEFRHDVRFQRLAPPLETAIFRIVQEGLANARRHSRSDRIRISMVQQEGGVRIEVEDWGIGFDPEKLPGKHFGLEGARERARLFGGKASIDSAPGKGTRVTVVLPLVERDEEEVDGAPP